MAFYPDGSRLATAFGRQVKLWDIRSGQELLTLSLPEVANPSNETGVAALAFSPDGQRLYAALADGTVRYWEAMPASPAPVR